MKFEDALRKIRLLRQVKPENGSSEAEAESAAALVRTLMERFAVKPEETRPANGPLFRMSWVYSGTAICSSWPSGHWAGDRLNRLPKPCCRASSCRN